MNAFHTKALFASVVSLTLFACSSSSDTGNQGTSSSTFTKFGVIDILDAEVSDSLEIIASFFETDRPISLSNISAVNTISTISADRCEFDINDGPSPDTISFIDDSSVQINTISAGDVITISGAPGTVAELRASPVIFGTAYFGEAFLAEADSSGLTADIPGAAFPAFSSVTIPDVEPFILTSEIPRFDTAIDAQLRWTPSDPQDSYIILYTDLEISTATVGGPDTVQHILLDCLLVDDGSFELPTDIQSQLTAAGIDSLPMNIGREAVDVIRQGDTVLFVSRGSGDI